MRSIRASDIGAYLYCRRAWWYQLKGHPSKNQAELLSGTRLHARHGQRLIAAGLLRLLAYGLLLAALVLLAVSLTLSIL